MTPAQHRADHPGSDLVTLRNYSNLKLRLFYSKSTGPGSKASAPAIYGVTSSPAGADTVFSAHVVGDPKADVQEVWVAFTAPGSHLWDSFDLTRDGTDPTLWKAPDGLSLPAGTQFFVQAVNGFGLVSQNDNSGAYYQAGVAASTPASSSIALSGATSGVFGARHDHRKTDQRWESRLREAHRPDTRVSDAQRDQRCHRQRHRLDAAVGRCGHVPVVGQLHR